MWTMTRILCVALMCIMLFAGSAPAAFGDDGADALLSPYSPTIDFNDGGGSSPTYEFMQWLAQNFPWLYWLITGTYPPPPPNIFDGTGLDPNG